MFAQVSNQKKLFTSYCLLTTIRLRFPESLSPQTLKRAVQRDPFFVIAKLDLARYYDQDGNTERADQLFQEALEVHPDSFDGHIHYGEFLYEKVR